ncbi:MAG: M48 family metalloprotease [Acidobacteriia bacterium]|nr:M48 family metalloprotease [Terriglobia bacterium]
MSARNLLLAFLLLTLAGFTNRPARAEEPVPSKALYNTFSDEEEMSMGREAAQDVEKKYTILNDAALEPYLQDVGRRVAEASRRPKLDYHFKVVDTSAVNAFSLPGGYVYVDRGLLDFVGTESELVGVLAHEVGHVVAYHSMNDVARRWLVDRLVYEGQKAGLMSDQQIHDMLQQYGGAALLFVNRKFNREEENEADLLGLYNTERAGWDPEGLVTFLNQLTEFGADRDIVKLLLRRHPLPEERVETLKNELKQHPSPAGLKRNSSAFRRVKEQLKLLPPSPPPPAE